MTPYPGVEYHGNFEADYQVKAVRLHQACWEWSVMTQWLFIVRAHKNVVSLSKLLSGEANRA